MFRKHAFINPSQSLLVIIPWNGIYNISDSIKAILVVLLQIIIRVIDFLLGFSLPKKSLHLRNQIVRCLCFPIQRNRFYKYFCKTSGIVLNLLHDICLFDTSYSSVRSFNSFPIVFLTGE